MENLKTPASISASQSNKDNELISRQSAEIEGESGNRQATERFMTSVRRFGQKLDWSLVAMILAIKGLVFVYAAQAYHVLQNKPIETWRGTLAIWNHWDSLRHTRLETAGYVGAGSDKTDIVGFPLYPSLVRLFAFVFQDNLLSAFIVSALATIAAGLLLQRLVKTDYSDSIARNSVWFLLIFPTSHFLHINYNESLFVALAVGCFLAARRERWLLAGVLGAFLCLTRLNGLVIFPALIIEAFSQYRTSRRLQWQWLWILLILPGFGVFLLLNVYVAGDAFAFIAVGRETFQKSFQMPWRGIGGVYDLLWSSEVAHREIGGVQEFTFIVLGAIATIVGAFLLRPSYTVWMAGNWLLITSVGFIISVPRLTLAMFPIFILFAKLAERRFWHSVITVWSLLFLALFINEFIQGHWTF